MAEPVEAELVDIEPVDAMWVESELVGGERQVDEVPDPDQLALESPLDGSEASDKSEISDELDSADEPANVSSPANAAVPAMADGPANSDGSAAPDKSEMSDWAATDRLEVADPLEAADQPGATDEPETADESEATAESTAAANQDGSATDQLESDDAGPHEETAPAAKLLSETDAAAASEPAETDQSETDQSETDRSEPAETGNSEPADSEGDPTGTSQSEPGGTDGEPTGTDDEPAGTDSQPTGTDDEPAGTDSQQAGTDDDPAGTDGELTGTSQNAPAAAGGEPVAADDPDAAADEAGAAVETAGVDDERGVDDSGAGDRSDDGGAVGGAVSGRPAQSVPVPLEEAQAAHPAEPTPRGPIRQRRDAVDIKNRRTDPEKVLAGYPVTFDPETLREEIEDQDSMWTVIDRLTDKLEYAERDADRARLLSLRAVAGRLLGDFDPALADAEAALEHARATGELRRIAIVQARLGQVRQWRGEHAEADRLYAEAASPELPARLRAEIHELAGRSAFEQGRYLEAMNHFETALDLRKGADLDLVERIELALDTITQRTAQGWGPYPRTRDQILGHPEPPRPLRDDRSGLWGYVGAVPPRFAQAQPFAEGLAWVRRPESPAWELIDLDGRLVIDASHGYRAAERFAEGLAWVSRDEAGGWYAIDRHNRLIVPGGFEDAKPFRHGLASVRRGGWGVIDQHGRVVVQPRYRGFVTPLVSGGPIDGFTDEGLVVADVGDRYGVIDRTGREIVPPVHAAVVIHPVAFLIADQYGLWGALTRAGEPMVELKFKDRADVLEAIDQLVTDGRPVL